MRRRRSTTSSIWKGSTRAVERMQLRLYRPPRQPPQRVHLRIIRRGEALSVSDVLPTFEHFGLRVIAERPYRLELARWQLRRGCRISSSSTTSCSASRCRAWRTELIAAFRAVRAGELDDDGFNRLLIAAELSMRQVTVLRACCRYLLQTGIPFSQSYMERVLGAHAAHSARPVRTVRAAPGAACARAAHARARDCSSSACAARSRRSSARTRIASCAPSWR